MSGADDLIGLLVEGLFGDDSSGAGMDSDLLGTMSDIAGAEFVQGAGSDPVSALLGMSDIAGGDADMLGLSLNPLNLFRRKRANKKALVRAAINAKLAKHGAAVLDRRNQKARRFPSPLPATIVAAGAAATISTQPQTLFRPERLVVPASLAPSFVLTDVKVGNVSQFPNAGELPLEIFAQNGVDCTITLDTVNPAISLSVSVINITGGALTFRGGFIGTSVQ